MTQKERQERSKEEIYQAALEEFGTFGYDQVNMERICGKHGISKGMMYHYYSNKDDLFLSCVKRTFTDLKAYIEQEMETAQGKNTLDTVKNYFLTREYFFQFHPKQKVIFENAMIRPPKHLAEQIQQLRAPIREMNRKFLSQFVARMALRPGLDYEKATRYLETMGSSFQNSLAYYQGENTEQDLHSMLEMVEDLLDMILFGVLQQVDGPSSPAPNREPPAGSGRNECR